MTKLTDLQICQRVAVIDGHVIDEDDKYPRGVLKKNGKIVGYVNLNYFGDNALCFQLMVKYQVDVIHDGIKQALIYNDPEDNPIGKAADKNMNKAILLAIIEAHS